MHTRDFQEQNAKKLAVHWMEKINDLKLHSLWIEADKRGREERRLQFFTVSHAESPERCLKRSHPSDSCHILYPHGKAQLWWSPMSHSFRSPKAMFPRRLHPQASFLRINSVFTFKLNCFVSFIRQEGRKDSGKVLRKKTWIGAFSVSADCHWGEESALCVDA